MKELSVSDIMAFEPCYSENKIVKLFDGKDSLSLLDILDLDIPEQDKVWVLTQPGVLSDALLKEFVALMVDRAVRQHCLTCGFPKVEAWAVKWLDGSDRSTEAACAAREAAYYAAWMAQEAAWMAQEAAWVTAYNVARAAYYAARAAYWAACEAAACGAAYEASRVAYWAAKAARAACDVACDAACNAERQQQIADLRRLVGV